VALDSRKYWPFDVMPPERRSDSHSALIILWETTYRSGHAPYIEGGETLLGFGSNDRRSVEYIYRGGRNRYWEPWLCERGASIRLGPIFGLPEHTCVVFDGIEHVATFTIRWLDDQPLREALAGIPVFSRSRVSEPLRISDAGPGTTR
jgi:hypothetical protein